MQREATRPLGVAIQRTTDDARHLASAHLAITSIRSRSHSFLCVSLSARYSIRHDVDPMAAATLADALVAGSDGPVRRTRSQLRNDAFRGVLAVPLRTGNGDDIGVLGLFDRRAGDFSADDVHSASVVARTAELAIEADAAREEVRRQRHHLDAVLDAAPVPVIEVDRDGTVSRWSRTAVELLCERTREASQRGSLCQPEAITSEVTHLHRRLKEGAARARGTVMFRQADGRLIEVSLSAAALRDDDGSMSGAVIVLTDQSEMAALRLRMLDLALERLSPREREVVDLLARGSSYKEMASDLGLTEGSIGTLAHRAYEKLGVGSRYELAQILLRRLFERRDHRASSASC